MVKNCSSCRHWFYRHAHSKSGRCTNTGNPNVAWFMTEHNHGVGCPRYELDTALPGIVPCKTAETEVTRINTRPVEELKAVFQQQLCPRWDNLWDSETDIPTWIQRRWTRLKMWQDSGDMKESYHKWEQALVELEAEAAKGTLEEAIMKGGPEPPPIKAYVAPEVETKS